MKTFGNQASFVALNGSIEFAFDSIYPVTTHYISSWWWCDKRPLSILEKCIKLFIHNFTPVTMFGIYCKGGWFLSLICCFYDQCFRKRVTDIVIDMFPWLINVILGASNHRMAIDSRLRWRTTLSCYHVQRRVIYCSGWMRQNHIPCSCKRRRAMCRLCCCKRWVSLQRYGM